MALLSGAGFFGYGLFALADGDRAFAAAEEEMIQGELAADVAQRH